MAKRGRPTKYNAKIDYIKLADDYLETCGREQTKLPKLSEYASGFVGVFDDTLIRWSEKYPENENLCSAIKKVRQAQKHQLMDDGLYGGREVNNAMAIFLLKANHGMIETERRELIGGEGEPIKVLISRDFVTNYAEDNVSTSTESPGKTAEVSSFGVAPESS